MKKRLVLKLLLLPIKTFFSLLQPPIPPFLAPFLAASREAQSGAPSMKEAFQEVLKIFGFPPELAEVFAKNAQALQQGLPGHLQPQQPSNESIKNDEGTETNLTFLFTLL